MGKSRGQQWTPAFKQYGYEKKDIIMEKITELMNGYIENQEIAGAAVRVYKNDEIVYSRCFGYADAERQEKVTEHTIFRLASMTKPITAMAVMKLTEAGKLCLEDPLSKFIPEFKEMQAAEQPVDPSKYYSADPDSPVGPIAMQHEIESMTFVSAKREVTIYDCLSHSSGMGMGAISTGMLMEQLKPGMTLKERIKLYAATPLDFQPGEGTGYSAFVTFDTLAYIVELVSGMDFSAYLNQEILKPLGIADITFRTTEEQRTRMSGIFLPKEGTFTDVSGTDPLCTMMLPEFSGYCSGGAGLSGTLDAYGKIARMYVNGGICDGVRILKEETVAKMAGKDVPHASRFIPEAFWGLGLAVFDRPKAAGRGLEPGSFGWSGAFGTHFYADPKNRIAVVLMINSANLGGADSYISKALEKAVYASYIKA